MSGEQKISLKYPVIVEGKYDKIKLSSIFDARIITTDGFGIFSNEEKKKMFISLSEVTPLIIASDSDGAGLVIRNYFKGIIRQERLYHVYIPDVKGKEKRKKEGSKAGTLGLEGMTRDCLIRLFEPYFQDSGDFSVVANALTKGDFYEMGLSGGQCSKDKRRYLCQRLSLPENISASALLDIVNMLYDRKTVERIMSEWIAEDK